jgi:hypothetical protein
MEDYERRVQALSCDADVSVVVRFGWWVWTRERVWQESDGGRVPKTPVTGRTGTGHVTGRTPTRQKVPGEYLGTVSPGVGAKNRALTEAD